MIAKEFFVETYETSSIEWLLAELDGREESIVIGELEEQTWEEARRFDLKSIKADKDKSPSRLYLQKLVDALAEKLNRAFGDDTAIYYITVGSLNSYVEIFDEEIYNKKTWATFLEVYGGYRKFVRLIANIRKRDALKSHDRNGVVAQDIQALPIGKLLDKYQVSDEVLASLGLTIPTEFMPARLRDGVTAAIVVKSYIDENLNDEYLGWQASIENEGIEMYVVLRGEYDYNPVENIADVRKITK